MIRPCLKQILTTQLKWKWYLIEILVSLMISTVFLVFVLFCFLLILALEPRALCMLITRSTIWATCPSLLFMLLFPLMIMMMMIMMMSVCGVCACMCRQTCRCECAKPEDNFTCWATSPTLLLNSHWYKFLQIMSIKFPVLPNFAYFITYLVAYR